MIFRKFFNKDADKTLYFAQKFNLSPRIMELILSRGISTEEEISEYLNPTVLADPFLLKGMKELCDRLVIAKELGDRVLIFGDYDVDGVSATAIMLKALSEFGIKASHYLPNRYVDGYGLTNAVIDKIIDKFDPNLIITVDCGISCHDEVEYALSKGVEVIVTDHHDIPEIIPETIVVNAKLEGQEFPFKEICGTGVAYKVAEALLGREKAEKYLPIAAIATIVDIVPLLSENRTIVTRGLGLMEKYLPVGLKAICKDYDIDLKNPNSTDISFKIGPKLNASGRMGDAEDSLKLYFETDPVKIKKCIEKIKNHNTKRQDICNRILDDCERALSKQDLRFQRVICLASKKWDKGVLGIVCSRLVDKYHKPVFLFSQEGDVLSGSGRSIQDINIHALLSSLKDMLETYGGHSMAAGLSLKRNRYEEFVSKVNAFALEKINDSVFMPISYYDQEISEEEITSEFLEELKVLEPCGCDNPTPKFKITVNNVEILPMKRFPQHATIKIGNLNLVYFNILKNIKKITFSRQKSFIFEFQQSSQKQTKGEKTSALKGVVDEFDGGSFIAEDAYKKLNPIEIDQLKYSDQSARFKLYPKSELLSFVGGTLTSVFGTCFVTFSCFDYVDFAKNYNVQGIYHFGINDESEIGYNSLLISPKGLNWAKNFTKIVFLSPVIDESYLSVLSKATSAEIFVPIDKKNDVKKYAGVDLDRETYAHIFKALEKFNGKTLYNEFDLYDKLQIEEKVSFMSFYSALQVFDELGLITIPENEQLTIYINKNKKNQLTNSELYCKLERIKSALGRE